MSVSMPVVQTHAQEFVASRLRSFASRFAAQHCPHLTQVQVG